MTLESQNDCIQSTPTLPFSPDLAKRIVMWDLKNQCDMISIMTKIPGVKELVETMWHSRIGSEWCQIFPGTFSWIHFLKFLANLRHMNLYDLDGITTKLCSKEEFHIGKTSYLPPTYITSTSLKKPTGADDSVHSPISLQSCVCAPVSSGSFIFFCSSHLRWLTNPNSGVNLFCCLFS